jgi:predicted RNase H-like nuclease (RuvC/YqgF family)
MAATHTKAVLVAWLTLEKRRLRRENERLEQEVSELRAQLARVRGERHDSERDGGAALPVGDAHTDHRRDG